MKMRFVKWAALAALVLGLGVSGCAWGAILGPNYLLRDVSRNGGPYNVTGAQWFAVVNHYYLEDWNGVDDDYTTWQWNWETYGGAAPADKMPTLAGLPNGPDWHGDYFTELPGNHFLTPGFNPVYFYDYYQEYFDEDGNVYGYPSGYYNNDYRTLESVYAVVPEGRGEMDVNFYIWDTWGASTTTTLGDIIFSVPGYVQSNSGSPTERVDARLSLSSTTASYGSQSGYLTFRQTDANNELDSINIPMVVANVYDGLASARGHELYFDMTVLNGSNQPVARRKFRWGAGADITQDIGTLFSDLDRNSYTVRTRITNRTGTRYRLQRYDESIGTYPWGNAEPLHWDFDLTPDRYGSLPHAFALDSQSQIAPGLVTTYGTPVNIGRNASGRGTSAAFRLYPFQAQDSSLLPPHSLTLAYRRIGGMSVRGTLPANSLESPWSLTAFTMQFTDIAQNAENTSNEITQYTTTAPVQQTGNFAGTGAADTYINAEALSSFAINIPVTGGTGEADPTPMVPVNVRMRISRQEQPLAGRWNELAEADDVIAALGSGLTVWARSPNTSELDMDLFQTLRNRGYRPQECVRAFVSENPADNREGYLYLDFIVLLADAESKNAGKTAFCEVIEDDGVPYILIGDGLKDGNLTLSFFAALPDSLAPTTPNTGNNNSDSGGGCSAASGAGLLLTCGALFFCKFFKGKKGRNK